jgi:hypothetical protein
MEYVYGPKVMKEPYLSRRRKVGFDLLALYGVDRHYKEARARAFPRNYDFLGAPVGLFVTMERSEVLKRYVTVKREPRRRGYLDQGGAVFEHTPTEIAGHSYKVQIFEFFKFWKIVILIFSPLSCLVTEH